MRVCILIERYFPHSGGTEIQARNLALGLRDLGVETIFVTRRSSPEMGRKDTVDGMTVYRGGPPGRSARLRWALAFSSFRMLLAHGRKYDVLLVSSFRTLGVSAVLAAGLLRKPCVLKADSLGEFSGECFAPGIRNLRLKRLSPIFRCAVGLRNRILRKAAAFISMSSEITAEFIAYGANEKKIRVIPNIVDTTVFRPAAPGEKAVLREKLGLPAKSTILTYTGRLVSYKGLPLLLRVWKQVAPEHPEAILVLVGSGSEDIDNCEEGLRDYAKANQLDDSVRFAGRVENVDEYLKASDAFVFPTENEAFGLSLIEAMACSLPAVASAAGGVRDIIQAGENGLLVKVGDEKELLAGIRRILTDESLRNNLGRRALDTVNARYTRGIVAGKYAELLGELGGHLKATT